jgi:hypothetical protein
VRKFVVSLGYPVDRRVSPDSNTKWRFVPQLSLRVIKEVHPIKTTQEGKPGLRRRCSVQVTALLI